MARTSKSSAADARELCLRARWIVVDPRRVLREAALVVRAGRVARVVEGAAAVAREMGAGESVDFGDALIAPGFVNAHAHLELGALAGRTPRGPDFSGWVRSVIALRAAETPEKLAQAAQAGAAAALASGTTTVADIDTTGAAVVGLAGHALRVLHLREVLDAHDVARTEAALARVAKALPKRTRQWEGLSPHAPFTVSPTLLERVASLARKRRLAVQMHWAETPAEVEWMERGSGPLAALLGPSPRASGLDLLERAGLLGSSLSLVHGNHPLPGELERLGARGVTLVHCPGSHAWFERAPFDWRRCARAGVTVALGTDSLASNEALDLRREMRLVAAAQPQLGPAELLEAATRAGARALGRAGELGELTLGAQADWLVLPTQAKDARTALEELTLGREPVLESWVAGRRAGPSLAR